MNTNEQQRRVFDEWLDKVTRAPDATMPTPWQTWQAAQSNARDVDTKDRLRHEFDIAGNPKLRLTILEREAIAILNTIKAAQDGGLIKLTVDMQMRIDVVLTMVSVRRIGVA